jgi:hypothetical protein
MCESAANLDRDPYARVRALGTDRTVIDTASTSVHDAARKIIDRAWTDRD